MSFNAFQLFEEALSEWQASGDSTRDPGKTHARANDAVSRAAGNLPANRDPAMLWFTDALGRADRRHFVVAVLRHARRVPEPLVTALLRAGLVDAEGVQPFVQPVLAAFGAERVRTELETLAAEGTEAERKAAAQFLARNVKAPG
ncbi:MAG: hypothetical protein U0169_18775 [Polyangiaceae bacterium]